MAIKESNPDLKGFQPPTYEEYVEATNFARFRYKWGLIVTVFAWITLLVILLYVIQYATELKTHPMQYTAKKFGLQCSCYDEGRINEYLFNESEIFIRPNPLGQLMGLPT